MKGDKDDNCKIEFVYSKTQKGSALMLPVVMEAAMCDQRTWVGPVGILGQRMYVNCSTTDDVLPRARLSFNTMHASWCVRHYGIIVLTKST